MGGLRDIKGIFTLIRALRIVVKEYPDLRCIMPGSDYSPPRSFAMWLARTVGPLFNHAPTGLRAIKMISAFGLEQVCIRLPYRTDIPDIIAASSIVLFPSRKPHFARPVIEASAMGKPVVASALPGVSELIRDGETGTLIPPGNPRALARAIGDLLADPERMRALGNNGYRLAHDNFSRMTACQRIMAIYADALP
jgi:glycosyltransferase involved in cell wall biosynthesis